MFGLPQIEEGPALQAKWKPLPRFTPAEMEKAIRSLGQAGRDKARARKARANEKAHRSENAARETARLMKPSFLALAEVVERLGVELAECDSPEQREAMWQALGPTERTGKQAAWCKDLRNLGWTGKRKEPGWSTVPPEGFEGLDLNLPDLPLLADEVLREPHTAKRWLGRDFPCDVIPQGYNRPPVPALSLALDLWQHQAHLQGEREREANGCDQRYNFFDGGLHKERHDHRDEEI
jgi:hypothetical protein